MFKNKIIIGTWSLSGSFGKVEKKEIYKPIEFAIESGFLEFDVAPNYGNGMIEEIFADIIKYNNTKLIINKKCGNSIKNVKSYKDQDIIQSLNRSLESLKAINILYLHCIIHERFDLKIYPKLLVNLNFWVSIGCGHHF